MAISGLVITLEPSEAIAETALRSLRGDPRLSLGQRAGWRIPLVAETDSAAADADLWADLLATPGVRSVDVTFVSFDPPPAAGAASNAAGRFS